MPRTMLRRIRKERAVTRLLWVVTVAMLAWMGWAWASYLTERAEYAEEQAAQMDAVVEELRGLVDEQGRRERSAIRRAERNADMMQAATLCLIAQFHDHRDNTGGFHEVVAEHFGMDATLPAAPAPRSLPSGSEACRPFADGDMAGMLK